MKIRTAIIVVLALACAPLVSVAQTAPPPQTYAGSSEGFDNSATVYGAMNFGGDAFTDREKSSSGGVFYYVTPRFGIRADIRYRTAVGASTDPADGWGLIEGWNHMRGTIGATFAF